VEGGVADDSRNRTLAVFGNSNGTIEPATCANCYAGGMVSRKGPVEVTALQKTVRHS
jgi:hypothetical protein